MTYDIVIPVYGNSLRLSRMLEVIREQSVLRHITIVEDYSNEEVHQSFRGLAYKYNLVHIRAREWLGMQGTVQFAMNELRGDWMIYLPDDVLPTPDSIANVVRWLRIVPDWIGAVQVPYWNYDELFVGKHRELMLEGSLEWLYSVPINPHWYGPCMYVNVNGAGFALRRSVWEQVGGFSQKTWCLDEDISARIWLNTNYYAIVTIPGMPWIHQCGGSTRDQHKFGHYDYRESTIDGWLDEWGIDKSTMNTRIKDVMKVRSERYKFPMR